MLIKNLIRSSYMTIAAFCLSLSLTSLSYADLELVPLLDSEHIKACNQKATFIVHNNTENETPGLTVLFMAFAGTVSEQCLANPYAGNCVNSYPYRLVLNNSGLYTIPAAHLPNLVLWVGQVLTSTANPTPHVAVSKTVNFNFEACPYDPTTITKVIPGNGLSTENVTLPRGSGRLANKRVVARWLSKMNQIFGDSVSRDKFTISVGTRKSDVSKVVVEVSDSTGHVGHLDILASQKRIDPDTGIWAYVTEIDKNDWAAGDITIKAKVIPTNGIPFVMAGSFAAASNTQRLDNEFELKIVNNKNNAIPRLTHFVNANGSDTPTCGTTQTNACASMDGAIKSFHNLYPNSKYDGWKIKFGPGNNFVWGSNYTYLGPQTEKVGFLVEGTLSDLGEKQTVFTRAVDLTSAGYPGNILLTSMVEVKDVKFKKDPTSPNPRSSIVGPSWGGYLGLENVEWIGLGRDPGTCLSEGFSTTGLIDARRLMLKNSLTNGQFFSVVQSAVLANSSISFIDFSWLAGATSQVNHDVINCPPNGNPHGDKVKLQGGHGAIWGYKDGKTFVNHAQGLFLQGNDILVEDSYVRMGDPGQPAIGGNLFLANYSGGFLDNILMDNVKTDAGWTRYGWMEGGYGPLPTNNVIKCNNCTLSTYPNEPGGTLPSQSVSIGAWNYVSPYTGVEYSTSSN